MLSRHVKLAPRDFSRLAATTWLHAEQIRHDIVCNSIHDVCLHLLLEVFRVLYAIRWYTLSSMRDLRLIIIRVEKVDLLILVLSNLHEQLCLRTLQRLELLSYRDSISVLVTIFVTEQSFSLVLLLVD